MKVSQLFWRRSAENPHPTTEVLCGLVQGSSTSVSQYQSPNRRGLPQWSMGGLLRGSATCLTMRDPFLVLWLSPFCCSQDGWNMCEAWDVLEAGRPNGELAAPSHLDTFQGRWSERLNSYLLCSGHALFIAPLARASNWPAAAYTVGVIQQSGRPCSAAVPSGRAGGQKTDR